jgi:hypothetical protein
VLVNLSACGYSYSRFEWSELSQFSYYFFWQREYFVAQVKNGDLPTLGVFQKDEIWQRNPEFSRKPGYPTIIFIDYTTGRLYVGFTKERK